MEINQQNIEDLFKLIPTFDKMWDMYIKPLEGKTIPLVEGESNKIISVDKSGVRRETSTFDEFGNPNINKIPRAAFEFAYMRLLQEGQISRGEIYQTQGWCSSGVIAILAQLPFVRFTHKPATLWLLIPSI